MTGSSPSRPHLQRPDDSPADDDAPPAQPTAARSDGTARFGGPVSPAWREGSLTRAMELESLSKWVVAENQTQNSKILLDGVAFHLEAAREAARGERLHPRKFLHPPRAGSLRERAMSNLDAAEAQLLNLAPEDYLLGQMPSLLQHVRRHLDINDPRRQQMELIARRLSLCDPDPARAADSDLDGYEERKGIVHQERGKIVTAMRAASSAALREQVRLRSFRNTVVAATVVMSFLAAILAVTGWLRPTWLPLCFAPEEGGEAMVVCPTQQSDPFNVSETTTAATNEDIDKYVESTAMKWDILVVELVGLTAAAVAAAGSIRNLRGSSERYGLPTALAGLKIPTGAVTALLGLLLMRGQFVPGLSALDTSAQIIAWALVFGYAQQLFTRLVDQQGQTVLSSVRGASEPQRVSHVAS